MADRLNQERDLVSDKSSSGKWRGSLWFIFLWTVLILPFWMGNYYALLRGTEVGMLENGMVLRHACIYYAGISLVIFGPTLGLVLGVFLKRKLWPCWVVFICGFVAAFVSLIVGNFAVLAAYSIPK